MAISMATRLYRTKHKRSLIKNDFQKNLYKLMNNVVFGNHGECVISHRRKVINKMEKQIQDAEMMKPNREIKFSQP